MKKIIVSLLSAVLAGLMLAVPAAGQSPSLFYGEYHNYSVTFKEDGEAIVFAKLVFTNSTDTDQTTYSFKASKTQLKELSILQVKLPQECADYTQVYDYTTGTNKCARYRDPDYNSYYNYSYGATGEVTYQSAKVSNEGLKYTIALPEALKPDKTSALLVAYTSTEYAKNQFLAKSFSFPTLTTDNRITEAKVGISVDEGLVLEGVTTPEYCSMGMCPISLADNAKMSSIAGSSGSSAPVTNRILDNLYASIGTGQRTYQSKSISPSKPFTAKGRYASSELRLNSQKTTVVILGLLVAIAAITYLSLKLKKKSAISTKSSKTKQGSLSLTSDMVPVFSLLPMAGLIGGTWYLSTGSFSNDVWGKLGGAGKPLFIVFVTIVYGVLVTIAPIIYGLRRGWRSALSVIIMQTIWATILLVAVLPFIIFG